MDQDALLARVRKLLAQAEDPSVTEAEAEAFNTKAADLIARYGIAQAHLAASGKTRDEVTQRRIGIDNPYSRDKASLLACVATPLRCKTVHHQYGKSTHAVTVFGFTSDLDRVDMLYTSLLLQATSQLTDQHGQHWESTAAYRRSWFAGFSSAVYQRLSASERHAAAHTPTSTGVSTALVLRDRTQQVEEAYQTAFPHLATSRARRLTGSGYQVGHAAGTRADLGATRLGGHRTALGP